MSLRASYINLDENDLGTNWLILLSFMPIGIPESLVYRGLSNLLDKVAPTPLPSIGHTNILAALRINALDLQRLLVRTPYNFFNNLRCLTAFLRR
jgi:hypothetical protein